MSRIGAENPGLLFLAGRLVEHCQCTIAEKVNVIRILLQCNIKAWALLRNYDGMGWAVPGAIISLFCNTSERRATSAAMTRAAAKPTGALTKGKIKTRRHARPMPASSWRKKQ